MRQLGKPGLPDGIFSSQKSKFGKFLEGLATKDVMAIWYILQPYGIFYGHLVYLLVIWYIFYRFGMLWQEKSGYPEINCHKVQSMYIIPRVTRTHNGRLFALGSFIKKYRRI
jgi:hypothetical protein